MKSCKESTKLVTYGTAASTQNALRQGQFIPYFQPIVALRTGQLAGFEILARWQHPQYGLVSPDQFISLAEKQGWIDTLTLQLLRKAFAEAGSIPEPLTLSVNISPVQLRNSSLPGLIRKAAEGTEFPLTRLVIEITESALIDNVDHAASIAKELKEMGCKLSLDDFGQGYSSLLHLQALPFDELKVDHGFVTSMTERRESRKIVAGVVGLGQSLGLRTVAEGIETRDQAETMLWLGCDMGQGWYFGRPLPAEDLSSVVGKHRPKPVTGDASPWKEISSANLDGSLSQQVANLQAVYYGAPVGLAFVDKDFRHININQRLADLSGISVKDHLGHTIAELVPPGMYPIVEPYLVRALKGEVISGLEVTRPSPRPGEGTVTHNISYQPARDEAGDVIGISIAVVDVTQSKRDEEARQLSEDRYESNLECANAKLLKSEKRFRRLLDSSPEAFLAVQNGIIELANEAAVRLFGVDSAERLIGRRLLDFVCAEDFLTVEHTLKALYTFESQPRSLQTRIRKDDHSEIDVDVTCSSSIHEGGSMILQAIFRDITIQKQSHARQAQLIRGIEQVAESIVITDVRGSITYVNPAFEEITGYSRAEAIGSNPRILKSGQHPTSFYRVMWETLRAGKTWSGDLINKRKDGSLLNEVATISPIRDEAGITVSYVAVKRDVTQELSLRRQLGQAQKMEAVGQLTGGIAHDFNNLLGIVIGNIELLQPLVAENADAFRRAQIAMQAANRGAELTRRLLHFSRAADLNPEPVDLHKSIHTVLDLACALGPDVKVTFQLDDSIPLVMVDSVGLESALLNLVVNARDAMPNGGTLAISTQIRNLEQDYPLVSSGELKDGKYALISVSDTGRGMSQQTLERVFEPFFTTKPLGKGTGLGMAMVYGFIKQSGGAAQISSEPGHGTTVTFCLQLAAPVPISLPATALAAAPAVPCSGKVLVVDDEWGLLEIAEAYLGDMAFSVYKAEDARIAIELLKQHEDIVLLVTDILMPGGMNGVELVEQARQIIPQVKVLYTSGLTAQAMTDRGLPMVDCTLLRKPYQRVQLEAAVRVALQ
jgi:PAS domain S-box-containing protein